MHKPLFNAVLEFWGENVDKWVQYQNSLDLRAILCYQNWEKNSSDSHFFIKKMKTGTVLGHSLNFVPEINQWCN